MRGIGALVMVLVAILVTGIAVWSQPDAQETIRKLQQVEAESDRMILLSVVTGSSDDTIMRLAAWELGIEEQFYREAKLLTYEEKMPLLHLSNLRVQQETGIVAGLDESVEANDRLGLHSNPEKILLKRSNTKALRWIRIGQAVNPGFVKGRAR